MAEIASLPGGREYLLQVTSFGLRGRIEVDGKPINGLMPTFPQIKDEGLVSVLNYLVLEIDPAAEPAAFEPFKPEELAATRGGTKLTSADVYELRKKIGLQ